jgi:REG-2-like HAD superfamily hydrolase
MSETDFEHITADIRVIALDAVGTLIYPAQPVAETYVEVAAQFGIHRTPETICERFTTAIDRQTIDVDYESDVWKTSEEFEQVWWRSFIADVFELEPQSSSPLFTSLWNHYANQTAWRLFEDAQEFLDAATATNRQIVIASNFDSRLRAICQSNPHLMRCKEIFVSSEVGYRKPSVNFYRTLSRTLGQPLETILMVGDDEIADYEGARNAGCCSMHLKRSGAHAPNQIELLTDLLAHDRAGGA